MYSHTGHIAPNGANPFGGLSLAINMLLLRSKESEPSMRLPLKRLSISKVPSDTGLKPRCE